MSCVCSQAPPSPSMRGYTLSLTLCSLFPFLLHVRHAQPMPAGQSQPLLVLALRRQRAMAGAPCWRLSTSPRLVESLDQFVVTSSLFGYPGLPTLCPPSHPICDSLQGIVMDSQGNIYIADTIGNRIRRCGGSVADVCQEGIQRCYTWPRFSSRTSIHHRVDHATGDISTFAGTGAPGSSGDNGPATSASLKWPGAVATDGTSLFIADTGNNLIRKVLGQQQPLYFSDCCSRHPLLPLCPVFLITVTGLTSPIPPHPDTLTFLFP